MRESSALWSEARQAKLIARSQRQAELERELREQFGLENEASPERRPPPAVAAPGTGRDGHTAATASTSSPSKRSGTLKAPNQIIVDGIEESSAASPKKLPADRRSIAKAECSASRPDTSSGPPRPPKPKPHRRLHVDSPCAADAAAGRRWKSALLPLWPDRTGGATEATDASRCGGSEICALPAVTSPGCVPMSLDPASLVGRPRAEESCKDPAPSSPRSGRKGCAAPSSPKSGKSACAGAPSSPKSGRSTCVAPSSPKSTGKKSLCIATPSSPKSARKDLVIVSSPRGGAHSVSSPRSGRKDLLLAGASSPRAAAQRQSSASHKANLCDEAHKGFSSDSVAASDASTSAGASPVMRKCPQGLSKDFVKDGTDNSRSRPCPRLVILEPAEDPELAERSRQLEENTKRLRAHAERVRLDNRRSRLFQGSPVYCLLEARQSSANEKSIVCQDEHDMASDAVESAKSGDLAEAKTSDPAEFAKEGDVGVAKTNDQDQRFQEMRRKIAELDELNALERRKLEEEQREIEERQRAQEAFEQEVQGDLERLLREHRENDAREAEMRAQWHEKIRKDLEDRIRRRQEQRLQEAKYSENIKEKVKEIRTEEEVLRAQELEQELDRQWAEKETQERSRFEAYARERRRQYEDWDRRLTSERQRLAPDAEFRAAAQHQRARQAAESDEAFYGPRRFAGPGDPGSNSSNKGRPQGPLSSSLLVGNMSPVSPDESAILKELRAVANACRDVQKAKVKELLLRWHPDKNPAAQAKATRLFQFVQKNKELILGF